MIPHTAALSVDDLDPYDTSIHRIASTAGAKITTKLMVRLPMSYESTLRATIERLGLVGRFSIEYSQGRACAVTWEGTP